MTKLLQDILNQPLSLAESIRYQFGPGQDDIQRAGKLLTDSPAVLLTGMGSSLDACHPLASYLASKGVQPLVFDTGELLHFGSRLLDSEIPRIFVSRSGETVEILGLLDKSRRKGNTIGVSNVPDSPLLRQADYPVLIGSDADQLVAVQTYSATIPVLLALGKAAFGELNDSWRAEVEGLVEPLQSLVRDCEHRSQELRGFLRAGHGVHFLGRGPSTASTHEGSLLFNEVAKTPAVAMSAGNFRHGPIEVVDEAFSAFVFATQSDTRELDLALARNVIRFGGQVQIVASGMARAAEIAWPIPDVSGLLAPVLEIVPVQLAAYRLAEWKGLTPGEFRYSGAVTRSEVDFS